MMPVTLKNEPLSPKDKVQQPQATSASQGQQVNKKAIFYCLFFSNLLFKVTCFGKARLRILYSWKRVFTVQ